MTCTCGQTARLEAWRLKGPFGDGLPRHDPACPAVNIPPDPKCPHLWRGDMGDLGAPVGYDRCARCGGLQSAS